MSMLGSVRALLDGIIDYAGTFPPANLQLPDAVRNYVAYRAGPDAWMLGRFVCPVRFAAELTRSLRDLHDRAAPSTRPRVSLLAGGDPDASDSIVRLWEDALALENSGLQDVAEAGDVWEVRLPANVLGEGQSAQLGRMLTAADEALRPAGVTMFFYEAGVGNPSSIRSLVKALQAHNQKGKSTRVGFKLRTGGLDAAAFPAPEQIARVLLACREADLPLKFTAGLHHPVRRFEPSVGAAMYGFLNVFGAALLSNQPGLDERQLQSVLLEEDASQFAFTDAEFAWRDYRIPADAIRRLRNHRVISFGSCSFDEPRDDLRELGILPPLAPGR
jgi:hypothetical protein